MGESPRAGPTRHTDPTSAAAATAAGLARTQHGGGKARPNYSSGRVREVRSPPKAGSAAPPPHRRSPLTLPPTDAPAHLHASAQQFREEQEPPPHSCGVGQCRGLAPQKRGQACVTEIGARAKRGYKQDGGYAVCTVFPSPPPSLAPLLSVTCNTQTLSSLKSRENWEGATSRGCGKRSKDLTPPFPRGSGGVSW